MQGGARRALSDSAPTGAQDEAAQGEQSHGERGPGGWLRGGDDADDGDLQGVGGVVRVAADPVDAAACVGFRDEAGAEVVRVGGLVGEEGAVCQRGADTALVRKSNVSPTTLGLTVLSRKLKLTVPPVVAVPPTASREWVALLNSMFNVPLFCA